MDSALAWKGWNGVANPLVGNGLCDDKTNNAGCNYDAGDCCLSNDVTNQCTNCTCHFLETCAAGYHPSVGDGFCNDITNNEECNFDGGDCCLSDVATDYCIDCTCHLIETCAAGFFPPSVGNGFCDDDTNILECNFDGGDCCGPDISCKRFSNQS